MLGSKAQGPKVSMSVDRDIDRLYQLPLEEFTEARKAYAARVKAAGDGEGAARVKGLEKPSVSAWAVNQLYWSAGREFDELVAAGMRLRQAQERSLKGGPSSNVRDASESKDRAVAAALRAAISGGCGKYESAQTTMLTARMIVPARATNALARS